MTALLDARPTTLPALAALAIYLDQHVRKSGDWQAAGWSLTAVAECCRALIPRGAA